jgi:hypothetical protein
MIHGEDFKFLKYKNVGTRQFSYWLTFLDTRPSNRRYGKRSRKELINFWSYSLGKLGDRWEYSAPGNGEFIIKVHQETDITIMLLKYHR